MTRPAALGIEGCRGGWIWVSRDEAGVELGLVGQLCQIETRIARCGLALIDIPIGLKYQGPGWPQRRA